MKKLIVFLLMVSLCIPVIAESKVRPLLKDNYNIGDHDANLVWLKQEMLNAGYYSADEKITDLYDMHLQRRIKSFQFHNSLPVTGFPDTETMNVLFSGEILSPTEFREKYASDSAIEPDNVLIFGDSASILKEGDTITIKLKVQNTSSTRQVVAYEICATAFNAWNEAIDLQTLSVIEDINPNSSGNQKTIKFKNSSDVFEIWAGICRVRYSDGVIVTIPENQIIYAAWGGPIRFK